jgi:trk system potassium uptake protein TrkA
MRIVICGAGQVGSHAAQVLATGGHQVTLVDHRAARLMALEQNLDIKTSVGSCANADVLRDAGAAGADMLVAATNSDEVNLLTASVGKALAARRVVARVHHSAYFDQRGLDYRRHLGIDELICPEYSTAQAIASLLRNPGALAIESFGRGRIQMQELGVESDARAVGQRLMDVGLPGGMRLAAIERGSEVFIPDGQTVIQPEDHVILVGNEEVFAAGRRAFGQHDPGRQKVVVNGGPAMAVWLCRALRGRLFSIRLFESDEQRAEELAAKLEWVTVIREDPTDPSVFEEERLSDADAFIGLLSEDDDERNIISCAVAKQMGARRAVAVVQRPELTHLLKPIGIDAAFNPRILAAREIIGVMEETTMLSIASLAQGVINVYRVKIQPGARVIGQPLREVKLTPDWMIAAIQHGDDVRVPGAEDQLHAGDVALVVGRRAMEGKLKRLLLPR